MTQHILIRQQTEGRYQWSANLGAFEQGGMPELLNYVAQYADDEFSLILLLPDEEITLKTVRFDADEKKLLRQTVPFSLEEELSVDIDELHFALAKPNHDQVAVAIAERRKLADWLAPFQQAQLELTSVLPESLLLPWQPEQWHILIEDDRILVRTHEHRGFAVPLATGELALTLLIEEAQTQQTSPQHILVSGNETVTRPWIEQVLPAELVTQVEFSSNDYWSLASLSATDDLPNLLQGEFAPRLPWAKWWRHWKLAAVAGVVALLGHIIYSGLHIYSLEQDHKELVGQTTAAFRSVIPKGRMVDPVRQLQRKVSALQGHQGPGFIALYQPLAKVLSQTDGARLQSLTYNEKNQELRLTLMAPTFNAVEALRAKITETGLTAEMTGSSNETGGTRARLRVKR